jgi:hypothetical protein
MIDKTQYNYRNIEDHELTRIVCDNLYVDGEHKGVIAVYFNGLNEMSIEYSSMQEFLLFHEPYEYDWISELEHNDVIMDTETNKKYHVKKVLEYCVEVYANGMSSKTTDGTSEFIENGRVTNCCK